ncbi:hypothetical protein [Cohnella sp. GCM10012308]|uniref:hypothetical protein n=1 Tax=Cohnella sp. GCM10012308 TaxID=3317329 RepID=UPI0036178752
MNELLERFFLTSLSRSASPTATTVLLAMNSRFSRIVLRVARKVVSEVKRKLKLLKIGFVHSLPKMPLPKSKFLKAISTPAIGR